MQRGMTGKYIVRGNHAMKPRQRQARFWSTTQEAGKMSVEELADTLTRRRLAVDLVILENAGTVIRLWRRGVE